IFLVVRGIDARRGRIEEALDCRLPAFFKYVQVDAGGIMHYVRIVIAGEDVSCSTHICGKLINIFDGIDSLTCDVWIAEVGWQDLVPCCLRELGIFEVDARYPEPFICQTPGKMTADKAASTTN